VTESVQNIYSAAVAAGDLVEDPAQKELLTDFENIRAHFLATPKRGLRNVFAKAEQAPKGLYIWGGVGRGKSMLMDMFFASVQAPKRRVHFHGFMQEIHAGMHAARQTGVDDALKPVAEKVAAQVRLLAFDEMQISDITDAMIVGRLFEQLFKAGVVVVTTSNRAPDDLYKDGLNRQLFLPFIALIKTHLKVVHLQSPTDYRQNRLSGTKSYFSPANAAARAEIDKIWHRLSGGQSEALTLKVQGREVALQQFSNGVARVPFWELCGRALGPADYLAIAENVKVLILENVPALSRRNFNEARRFVTLIDALYEAKTRLIISAADIPDRLYLEGEGTFEFARTASRLIEMQSQGWAQDQP